MYVPKSFLSRLLAAAWTIFLVSLLLWGAIWLLAKIWIWIVVVVAIGILIVLSISIWHLRRERW
jgi:hypothetical protein